MLYVVGVVVSFIASYGQLARRLQGIMHAVTIVRPPCKFFGFGLWKLKYAHCGYCKIGSPPGAAGIDGMLWGCSDNSDHVDDCDKFDELKNFDMLSPRGYSAIKGLRCHQHLQPLMARSRCDALFMHTAPLHKRQRKPRLSHLQDSETVIFARPSGEWILHSSPPPLAHPIQLIMPWQETRIAYRA